MLLPLLVAGDDGVLASLPSSILPGRYPAGSLGPRRVNGAGVVRILPRDQLVDEIEALRPLDAGAVLIDGVISFPVGGVANRSPTSEANRMARHAANGRCAHHL
jgi:hypothetical protein